MSIYFMVNLQMWLKEDRESLEHFRAALTKELSEERRRYLRNIIGYLEKRIERTETMLTQDRRKAAS
jgi:hypothetical protein